MVVRWAMITFALAALVTALHFRRAESLIVKTPISQSLAREYIKNSNLPHNGGPNTHALGSYEKVENQAILHLAKIKFASIKPNLPTDLSAPEVGGWHILQALSIDPKGALLELIRCQVKSGDRSTSTTSSSDIGSGVGLEHLDAIMALLQAQGKGFASDLVDGDWALLLQRQAKKSPSFQKFVGKTETLGNTQSNFAVTTQKFHTIVSLFRGWFKLVATVQYKPIPDNFEVLENDAHRKIIVLRRIACDIVGGYLKLWKLPALPLPLRVKGGYLDFVYLDKDVRVTRGNRGGVFVHARPETLQALLAS